MSVAERTDHIIVSWSTQTTTLAPETTASTWSVDEVVEEHEGYWAVYDPQTGIFGSGPDEESARKDFENALREHLDVLERQESLSAALDAQLAYLRRRLS